MKITSFMPQELSAATSELKRRKVPGFNTNQRPECLLGICLREYLFPFMEKKKTTTYTYRAKGQALTSILMQAIVYANRTSKNLLKRLWKPLLVPSIENTDMLSIRRYFDLVGPLLRFPFSFSYFLFFLFPIPSIILPF